MYLSYNSDMGRVRNENQDKICAGFLSENAALAVVCDGMGGEASGSVASDLAANQIYRRISEGYQQGMKPNSIRNLMVTAVQAANSIVYEKSCDDIEKNGMGTTCVAVLVEDKSGISSLADLVDKKVGVSSGSTSAKALVKAMIDAGLIDGSGFDADTFDPALWTTGISFQQYDDYPAISTALSAGEVDAFCVDKSILAIYKTDGRSYIDDKFSPQEYGVATTKGSGFSAYVDELVQGWLADGTIDSLITENGLE